MTTKHKHKHKHKTQKCNHDGLTERLICLPSFEGDYGKNLVLCKVAAGKDPKFYWQGTALVKRNDGVYILRKASRNQAGILTAFFKQFGEPDSIHIFYDYQSAKSMFPHWFI